MERRWGGSLPLDRKLVTPGSIAADEHLKAIYEGP
jgi:hypothetical protein